MSEPQAPPALPSDDNEQQQQQPAVEETQQQQEQQQPTATAAATEENNITNYTPAERLVSTSFKCYDARQRGWLYESNVRSLLKRIIFAHHPDQDQLIDRAIVELQETATLPKDIDVPEQKENRISHDDFVRVVAKRIPEAKSAEEVASSFSAMKADASLNVLGRDRFVECASGADPENISKESAQLTWKRVFGGADVERVEYQPYRSAVNSVIHSTKIEAKA